ncbi:GAF domain-containing protein [Clostridium oceanicum]|uniref:GAF domain-containing protein n=1 Tax=Clostridium oceanicum TaxID=1543 RepID=A0ABP3V703_9CLOT
MFDLNGFKDLTQKQKYENMILFLKGQLSGETDLISNLSNAVAIINAMTDNINWVGVYFLKNEELVLGPFQGMPACNRIQVGKGVCGTAVVSKNIQRVDDVHKFKGHIACDSQTNSELVIPIIKDNIVLGVLDIDSMKFGRFKEEEEIYFKKFVSILISDMNWGI